VRVLLVVDDEDNVRRVLVRLLRAQGYEVLEASDGVEALEVLTDRSVDLAFVDMMMPCMDGLELLRWMQRDAPATKAVVLSGFGQKMDQAAREPNVVRTIGKPFEVHEILDAVRSALEEPE